MRLSEFNTDEATDLLLFITPHISAIIEDEDLLEELKQKRLADGKKTMMDVIKAGAQRLNVLLPIVLKKHRNSVYSILGAVNKKPAQDISQQPVTETMAQVKELLQDQEFWLFFDMSAFVKQKG